MFWKSATMVKRRGLQSNMSPSSSSDDIDDSNIEKSKKDVNGFLSVTQNFSPKKKQLKKEWDQDIIDSGLESSFLKRKHNEEEERSSSSETEYSNVKTVQRMMENVPSKLSKKLKKKKEKGTYSSNSLDESISNCQDKMKKKEKRSFGRHDLLKNDKSIVTSVSEDSESDSVGSDKHEYTKKNSLEQINLRAVKKEILSDDVRSTSADSDMDHNNETIYKKIETVIKNEIQSHSSSGSEDEVGKVVSPRKAQTKYEVAESPRKAQTNYEAVESPVTILQDIRLTPKSNSAKERLKTVYPGLKPIEVTTHLKLSEFDDVHLFRIPKNVDPKLLKRAKINLEQECKVDLGEKYVITPTIKMPDPTLVVSANTSVLFFKNNIKMEKYIKSKEEPYIEVPEKKSVALPENLKKRHPLFGSDFKQKIRLSEHVEKKLDEAIANLLKREKKSKKKKDKKNKLEDKEEKHEEIFDLFNSHNFIQDRIKKETSDDSAFGSSSSTDKPRGKQRDKGHISDRGIEQELEIPTKQESSFSKRKEKKKAEKYSNDHHWMDMPGIKTEIQDFDTIDTEELSASPKKKKKSSIMNSTLMSDVSRTPQFNSEVSTIVSEEGSSGKKSKKSKKDRISSEECTIKKEDLISELLNDVTMQLNVSKKVKTEF